MYNINNLIIEGRLCSELRRWQSAVSFAIAVDTAPYNRDDKKTAFFDVVMKESLADRIVAADDKGVLRKGRVVCVEGRLQVYTKEISGEKKTYLRVYATNVQFDMQPQQQQSHQQYQGQSQCQQQRTDQNRGWQSQDRRNQQPQRQSQVQNPEEEMSQDDIPF